MPEPEPDEPPTVGVTSLVTYTATLVVHDADGNDISTPEPEPKDQP